MAERESDGQSGYGTTLSTADTSGGSYTIQGEVTNISLSGIDSDVIDLTHSESPDEFREKIAGLGDAGQLTADLTYNAADTAAIYALHRVNKFFKISIAGGATWICGGFLKTLGQENPHDDKITQSITVELSGKPVFDDGVA